MTRCSNSLGTVPARIRAEPLDEVTLYARLWSRDSDAIAIRDHRRNWTWRDLSARAAAYRDALQTHAETSGAAESSDGIVPLLVDRTGETVAAILGILMSGRAFSPLSPDQPPERLRACLAALGRKPVLIVTDPVAQSERATELDVTSIVLEAGIGGAPSRPDRPDPDRLLYVLFTSGSTGVPKGVMVSHGNIENTMRWSVDVLEWRADDVIGNVAPFFFDISMFDLFTAVYFGVPMAIFSNASDTHATLGEIERHAITSIFSAPVFFSQFLRTGLIDDARLATVRRIVSGGDFFPPAHVLAWLERRPDIAVWNVWGPTETSIVNTMHRVGAEDVPLLEAGRHPSVGRAHPRMPFVLLDESGQVARPDAPGEICMIGACVTQGYLADAERTGEAYFEWEGALAFRTRDIGTMNADGDLFMVGRIGSMVKVAGYRIDLGEIESAAARLPGVLLCGAFVHEAEPGLRQIFLALEPRDGIRLDVFALKQGLRALLPSYMVPKRLFVLDALPRSANGKIDRRALPGLVSAA